jgi:copper chaperone NosL
MRVVFERANRILAAPLGTGPRGLLILAVLFLLPAYLAPLWKLTILAPQYPDGVRLSIYSYKLVGGNGGQDIKEINVLNHSIGMRDLTAADFTEFQWIPFAVGALGLLFLRCAVLGNLRTNIDLLVLYLYFGLFSLWSFGYKLYRYGHDLAPTAAVKVPPFMPPLVGHKKLANIDVYSFPGVGSYALTAAALVVAGAAFLAWREAREEEAADARVAG